MARCVFRQVSNLVLDDALFLTNFRNCIAAFIYLCIIIIVLTGCLCPCVTVNKVFFCKNPKIFFFNIRAYSHKTAGVGTVSLCMHSYLFTQWAVGSTVV